MLLLLRLFCGALGCDAACEEPEYSFFTVAAEFMPSFASTIHRSAAGIIGINSAATVPGPRKFRPNMPPPSRSYSPKSQFDGDDERSAVASSAHGGRGGGLSNGPAIVADALGIRLF